MSEAVLGTPTPATRAALPGRRRVLLVGWDGADWKAIDPLLDQGKMPHLQGLVERGVRGNLATLYPILSPMLWTTIATGKRPTKHGIHGFTEPDPATGGVRPITNLARKTRALWNILHLQGHTVNVVGWWPSHPAEPVRGVMVSNHFQQAGTAADQPWPVRPGTVHPPRLKDPLAGLRIHPATLPSDVILPFIPRAGEIDQNQDKRMESCGKIVAEISTIHAAATAIMQLEPWDFMAVYYDGIDHFGHGFMRYHPPRLPWVAEKDFEIYREVIEAGYRYHDMMLGTLLALAGENTTVVLVSDHGFHPDHLRPRIIPDEPAGPAEEHRHYGVLAMAGPGIKQDALVFGATLLDVTPTVLSLYGLPAGEDMDGKVLVEAFTESPGTPTIPSWDAMEGEDGSHPAGTALDPVEAREALDQLVALGYIDPVPDDTREAAAESVRELDHNLARAHMDAGEVGAAATIFRRLWDRWPDEHRFGVQLYLCELGLERVAAARRSLETVITRKTEQADTATRDLEGLAARLKGVPSGEISETDQRRWRQLRNRAGVHGGNLAFLRGKLLFHEGDFDGALEALETAGQGPVDRPALATQIGDVHLQMRRFDLAETAYRGALALDPQNAPAHLGLARAYLGQRRNLRAVDAALAGTGLLFHNPDAHFILGVALHRVGRIHEARRALDLAVHQNPCHIEAHLRLARLHARRFNDPARARHHRDRVREARTTLARLRRETGRPPQRDPGDPGDGSLPGETARIEAVTAGRTRDLSPDAVVTVVSGLPRSGTSMLMQMLAAGGMKIVSDGQRAADTDNPRGYFEHEKVKTLVRDRSWIAGARGQAVKIVAPLVTAIPEDCPSRVIFMWRPLGETVASQERMIARRGTRGAGSKAPDLARILGKQVQVVLRRLELHPAVSVLVVDYPGAVLDPAGTAARVNTFLGGHLDEAAMARAVDPELHRQRG